MFRLAPPHPLPVVLLSLALVACGDTGDPTAPAEVIPVATTLRIDGGQLSIQVPQTASMTGAVYDQLGRVMPAVSPTWTSRDATTVTVGADGTVSAVETGDAWIVATAAGLSDSVLVRARYPVAEGEARMRTRRSALDRIEMTEFFGWSFDLVGTDTLDRAYLEFAGPDGLLLLLAPPSTGPSERSLEAWSMEQLAAGASIFQVPTPGAYLFEDEQESVLLYVGTSGYLEVTDAGTPAASGGSAPLAGHLHLRAAGYTVTFDEEGEQVAAFVPTGDTVTCDLDFNVSVRHQQVGYAIGTFRDGPKPSESGMWDASVGWPNVNPPGTPLIELEIQRWGDELTAMIKDPQVENLAVFAQPPGGSFGAGNGYTSLRMSGYDPHFIASGQGGTVSLTKVTWPDPASPGELSGTIEASLLYWINGNPETAQAGTVSMEFHALWPPKEASPAAAAVRDERSPWRPLLSSRRR